MERGGIGIVRSVVASGAGVSPVVCPAACPAGRTFADFPVVGFASDGGLVAGPPFARRSAGGRPAGTKRRRQRGDSRKNLPSVVELPGFEPGTTEPKSAVLPLHHSSIVRSKAFAKVHKNSEYPILRRKNGVRRRPYFVFFYFSGKSRAERVRSERLVSCSRTSGAVVRCRPCVGFAVRRRFRKTAFAVLWKVRGGKAVSGSGRLGMVPGNEGWAGKRGGRPGGARLRAKPQDAAVCVRRPRTPPFGRFPQTGCSAGPDPGSAGRSSHCARHTVTAGRMGRISYMECL